MYKKERYSFYILFTLKAACGLAYRPQAAFAFDRYLSSSQLLVRRHDDGYAVDMHPACSMQHAASTGSHYAVVLATLSQFRTHAIARACAGRRWIELAAQQRASRLGQTAELFIVRYSS